MYGPSRGANRGPGPYGPAGGLGNLGNLLAGNGGMIPGWPPKYGPTFPCRAVILSPKKRGGGGYGNTWAALLSDLWGE